MARVTWKKLGPIYASSYMQKGKFKRTDTMKFRKEKNQWGTEFEGLFEPGQVSGFGRKTEQHSIYEGEMKEELFWGFGRFIKKENYYVGCWKNDKKHGRGKLVLADGTSEEGVWENGKLKEGKIIGPDGAVKDSDSEKADK